jgi:formiminoglutamase
MDIKFFLQPIDESIFSSIKDSSTFYKNITVFKEQFPNLDGVEIALIGINEHRGGDHESEGVRQAANAIRTKLYRLMKGTGSYRIVDLGNIGEAIDLDQTYDRLRILCEYLMERNILPIIIGGTHDMTLAQYKSYEQFEKLVSVLNVDAFLDMNDGGEFANEQHIHNLLMHSPNYLFNYSHLAYQSYLINETAIGILEKLYFETYRIGNLRQDLREMEPIIRQADMLSFDITAIRSADAPGNINAQPFGLSGEEACQLSWYAGLNDKLSSIGFYEYNPELDDERGKTASVIATMIWYFIEGFYHRKDSKEFRSNDYLKYVVSLDANPESIVFYKSKISEKWWMEVPFPNGRTRYGRHCIVPCSYSDYELAMSGEVPERWVTTQIKLV